MEAELPLQPFRVAGQLREVEAVESPMELPEVGDNTSPVEVRVSRVTMITS